MATPRIVNCPRCGNPVEWSEASRFRPFCSERCKLIDLGAWAMESYSVPVKKDESEQDSSEEDASRPDGR